MSELALLPVLTFFDPEHIQGRRDELMWEGILKVSLLNLRGHSDIPWIHAVQILRTRQLARKPIVGYPSCDAVCGS